MPAKVLFLTLRTFSFTGGIEQVSRLLSRALFDLGFQLSSARVFSLYDCPADCDSKYINKASFRAFRGRRLQFICAAINRGIRSDTVIMSHINLLIVGLLIKKLSPQTQIIVYAHGIEVWRPLKPWKRAFLNSCCEVWAVSQFTAQKMIQTQHTAASRITILPNCLDPHAAMPDYFAKPEALLKKYNLEASQPVLLTISRLTSTEYFKGYDIVIETLPSLLNEFPGLHYFLAGHGEESELRRLRQLIDKLGISPHVTLTGFLKPEDRNDHLLLSDAFVMPSRKEGFGIVFIEAAACGCRIIAGNQDGSSQALLNGRLGTLLPPANKDLLRKSIARILRTPRSEETSKAIQSLCLSHFNYDQYQQKVCSMLCHS